MVLGVISIVVGVLALSAAALVLGLRCVQGVNTLVLTLAWHMNA